jgi:hypothetical protein
METNRIKERLFKMYALATDGVDGEKETAQRILEENLAKYGLSIDDLVETDDKKEMCWFTAKDAYKKSLLTQLYGVYICKSQHIKTYVNKVKKYDVGMELTKSEYAELRMMYDFYIDLWIKELDKQKEALFLAFISKHGIALQGSDASKMTDEEIETAKRACRMMDDLEDVSFKKQIGSGQLELNM